MPAYCSKRSDLFSISVFFGVAVSAVVFQYHGNELSLHFDLPVLHRYLNCFLIAAYLLPSLVFYLGMYWLNSLLVRFLGKAELNEQRKVIMGRLLDASLSKQAVTAGPNDLVEEEAWISLRKYWRPE